MGQGYDRIGEHGTVKGSGTSSSPPGWMIKVELQRTVDVAGIKEGGQEEVLRDSVSSGDRKRGASP